MKTHYTIVQVPIRIEFECPCCYWDNAIDWNEVKSNDDEYGKWSGDIWSIECENCGIEVEFNECVVD